MGDKKYSQVQVRFYFESDYKVGEMRENVCERDFIEMKVSGKRD